MEPELNPEVKKEEEKKPLQVTTYELQDLVRRCLDELEQASAIETQSFLETTENGQGTVERKVIADREQIIQHISNTIIGELYELEMIRKIAPMVREVGRLIDDFGMLDERETKRINLAGLRIAPDAQQG